MGNRGPQQTVRAGQFEQRLSEIHMDLRKTIAADMAVVLAEFHSEWVAPLQQEYEYLAARADIHSERIQELEERVSHLERAWWKRLWLWVTDRVHVYRTDRVVDIAELAPDPEEAAA